MIADDLSRIAMSSNLEQALARAVEYARAQSHASVSLEHMLLALCEDEDAALVLAASNVDVARLRTDVSGYLGCMEEREAQDPNAAPMISGDLRRILEAADAAAKGGRRREINGAIVLAAVVGDGKSSAAHMLRSQGLTFEDAIRALQGGVATSQRGQSAPASADDLLATARQRVQSRATPGLRNIRREQGALPRAGDDATALSPPSDKPKVQAAEKAALPAPKPKPAPDSEAAQRPPQSETDDRPSPQEKTEAIAEEASPSAPAELKPTPPEPKKTAQTSKPPATPPSSAPPPIPPAASPGSWTPPPGAGGARSKSAPSRLPPSAPPPPPGASPSQSARPGPPPLAPWPDMDEISAEKPAGTSPSPEAVAHNLGLPPRTMPGPPPPSAPPPPAPSPSQAQARSTSRPAPRAEIGQLVENIPRSMRVDIPVLAEVRIARSDVKALAEGLQGGGAAYRHEVTVTKAMSVRLRAPDGGFFIETASPETQWIEKTMLLSSDDFASWRWNVTPREKGRKRLQLIISARTVSADGLAAETALPDQVITVRVKTNYAKSATRWAGWALAAVIGGLMARFGEGIFEFGKMALSSLTSG